MYLLYHETVSEERVFLLKCGQRGKVVSALISHIPHRGVYSLSLFRLSIPTAHIINNNIAIAICTQYARNMHAHNAIATAIIILHSIAYASKASGIHCIIQHSNIKLLMFYIVHGGTTAHMPTGKQGSESKVKQALMYSYNK